MQSKRRRVARCRTESASDLLHAYRERQSVHREGRHGFLRWLVIARSYTAVSNSTSILCPMDSANGMPIAQTVSECEALESHVAGRVFGEVTRHKWYLEYASAFFKWWFCVAQVLATPSVKIAKPAMCSWLLQSDVEKSLVVPDVRRAAVQVAQLLQVKAGEYEVASAQAGGRTRSVSAVLQALRTGEWNVNMHKTLMYGTIDDIYGAGLLDAVQIAIVDSRYQGRLGFGFAKQVLCTPSSECCLLAAWPLIYYHGTEYVVLCHEGHIRCNTFSTAYASWHHVCMANGGILVGRYNVGKCTI